MRAALATAASPSMRAVSASLAGAVLLLAAHPAQAATLSVELGDAQGVTLVGAIRRWDADGNPTRAVDPKARINAPYMDAKAANAGGGRWVFEALAPGRYDLLIVADSRVRMEGFSYPPVLEFDPFLPHDARIDAATQTLIAGKIKSSRHYENRVELLYMARDKKVVRTLVMLIRDEPTRNRPGLGSIRHEIWQYTFKYGGWLKEKRTRVLDRILLPVSELRRWSWLWDARLGGIEIKDSPITIKYHLPKGSDAPKLEGLYPY